MIPSSALHSAAAVRLAITRKLRTSTTGPAGTPRLTNYPELTADAVMGVVGLVLDERDAEIRRLTGRLTDLAARLTEMLAENSSEEARHRGRA